MLIYQLENGETADYVSEELEKYIKAVSVNDVQIKKEKGAEKGIILATFDTLGIEYEGIEDKKCDDAYIVDVDGFDGIIAGSNVRSILYGVYRYLYEAGCRFFRPGEGGEYIPQKNLAEFKCKVDKKASLRYRADCIEGSLSKEMIIERLKWLPKAGYNGYMIQGITPTNMLDRWYSHLGNKHKTATPLTWEQEKAITEEVEKYIKKYGLLFHDIGHEYMFPAYGIFRDTEAVIDDSLREHIALVNGERKIHGSIKYTNFCYSNPDVLKKISDYLVSYVKEKPGIDYLHLWLADNTNNCCQCEKCAGSTVSDIYVRILNYIDEVFTKNNIDTKIVFILYNDTMEPPEKEVIKNPSRFVCTVAVDGWYEAEKGYDTYDYETDTDFLDSKGNPSQIARIMRCRKKWEKAFIGDVFFFGYHMYSAHLDDMGHKLVTNRLARDAKVIPEKYSKGLMNCATSRLYMPTALPPYLCGLALFDTEVDTESVRDDYFENSFGKDGNKVKQYLDSLSQYLLPDLLSDTGVKAADEEFAEILEVKINWMSNDEAHKSFVKAREIIEKFVDVIESNLNAENECHRKSWQILKFHHQLCTRLVAGLVEGSAGDMGKAQAHCKDLIDYLALNEDEYALYFDYFLYIKRLRYTFGIARDIYARLD